jgi:hypothetical protein
MAKTAVARTVSPLIGLLAALALGRRGPPGRHAELRRRRPGLLHLEQAAPAAGQLDLELAPGQLDLEQVGGSSTSSSIWN